MTGSPPKRDERRKLREARDFAYCQLEEAEKSRDEALRAMTSSNEQRKVAVERMGRLQAELTDALSHLEMCRTNFASALKGQVSANVEKNDALSKLGHAIIELKETNELRQMANSQNDAMRAERDIALAKVADLEAERDQFRDAAQRERDARAAEVSELMGRMACAQVRDKMAQRISGRIDDSHLVRQLQEERVAHNATIRRLAAQKPPQPGHNPWTLIAAFVAGMAFLAALWAATAYAHPAGVPHDDGDLSRWFETQHSVSGGWCCDLSDAYYLGDDDWVAGARGYRVRIGDGWYDVPAGALRDTAGGPNPTGQAILWYYQSVGQPPVIWCFAPGTTY